MTISKRDSIKIITDLRKTMTLEQLCQVVEKGYYTLWRWSKGKGVPDKGDYELLKQAKELMEHGQQRG